MSLKVLNDDQTIYVDDILSLEDDTLFIIMMKIMNFISHTRADHIFKVHIIKIIMRIYLKSLNGLNISRSDG